MRAVVEWDTPSLLGTRRCRAPSAVMRGGRGVPGRSLYGVPGRRTGVRSGKTAARWRRIVHRAPCVCAPHEHANWRCVRHVICVELVGGSTRLAARGSRGGAVGARRTHAVGRCAQRPRRRGNAAAFRLGAGLPGAGWGWARRRARSWSGAGTPLLVRGAAVRRAPSLAADEVSREGVYMGFLILKAGGKKKMGGPSLDTVIP